MGQTIKIRKFAKVVDFLISCCPAPQWSIWPEKLAKILDALEFVQTWYIGVFGVADFESDVKTSKFKMTAPIWRQ